ncbi:MAG: peptidoglycan-binding protein [Clostridia bacterium]
MYQRLYVYEPERRGFCAYELESQTQMPYVEHLRFSISNFTRGVNTDLCWTDLGALKALDQLAGRFQTPFAVDFAFRRGCERNCTHGMQHCAGVAFDIGGALPPRRADALRNFAVDSGLFSQVEMAYTSGISVHVAAMRENPPLKGGDTGVYVFILQDLLQKLQLYDGALTGTFCAQTVRGVRRVQRITRLAETGRMNSADWYALHRLTNRRADAKMSIQV